MVKFKKRSFLIVFGLVISLYGMGEEISQEYTVRRGDVLSKIVSRFFPKTQLYGELGKLNQIVDMNSEIKDQHLIFPDQVIKLRIDTNTKKVDEKIPDVLSRDNQVDVKSAEILRAPVKRNWPIDVSVLYGAKYISYSQLGAIGQASLNGVFSNYFLVNTEISSEKFKGQFTFETFSVNYKTSTSLIDKSLYNFDFGLTRQWIFASAGVEQLPIISDGSGVVNLTKQSLIYIGLGVRKEIEVSLVRPVFIELKSEIRYPFKSFIDNSQAETNAFTGYHLHGQARFKMKILSKYGYTLFANWINDLGYQQNSQNIHWGYLNGKVETNMSSASSALGVLLNF